MKLNKAKSKFLHLGLSALQYQYRLGEEGIESGPAKKNLGVMVDETPPQELLQALGSPTQEKHGPSRGDWSKAMKIIKGMGHISMKTNSESWYLNYGSQQSMDPSYVIIYL